MITTEEDEKTIAELSLLSGVDATDVRKIFDSLQTQFCFKYTNNKRIHIPFVGSFLVRYRNDETTPDGKEAQVDAFYGPHPQIKRVVGQLKDIEKTGDYTNLDVFTNLKKQIKNDFKTTITSDDLL
jgi:hypothetical protein